MRVITLGMIDKGLSRVIKCLNRFDRYYRYESFRIHVNHITESDTWQLVSIAGMLQTNRKKQDLHSDNNLPMP